MNAASPLTDFFPLPLDLRAGPLVNGVRHWRSLAPFRAITSKGVIDIPAGFDTDLTSTPRVLWAIYAPADEMLEPAVIHDFLYSAANVWFTRQEADEIFKELMFNIGVHWERRDTVFQAVRKFGGRFYQGKRP